MCDLVKNKVKGRDIVVIAFVSALIFFFKIWAGSLSSWDEAFYAYLAKGLALADTWVKFVWGQGQWMDKPLFQMWVTAGFYKLFGVNEFATRLFPALCGVGVVLLTYLFAFRLFSRRVAIIAAIMLMSTYHFVWIAKLGQLDVALTLFMFLSVYFFIKSEAKRLNVLCAFLFFTMAFLTKGVGALIIPMTLVVYVLMTNKWNLVFNRYVLIGAIGSVLVCGGWFYVREVLYGAGALRDHFYHHLITRTMTTMDGHEGNWLTYINVLLYKGKPWGSWGLIAAPVFIVYSIRKKVKDNYILIAWMVVILLLFTVVKTKLHWYIIPIYPAVIIMGAWALEKVLKKYALVCVIIVSSVSLIYFGTQKSLFVQDHNPEIKKMYEIIESRDSSGNELYLYKIFGDPAIRYYFGYKGKEVNEKKDLNELIREGGSVVVLDKSSLKDIERGYNIIYSAETNLVLIEIKE